MLISKCSIFYSLFLFENVSWARSNDIKMKNAIWNCEHKLNKRIRKHRKAIYSILYKKELRFLIFMSLLFPLWNDAHLVLRWNLCIQTNNSYLSPRTVCADPFLFACDSTMHSQIYDYRLCSRNCFDTIWIVIWWKIKRERQKMTGAKNWEKGENGAQNENLRFVINGSV